METKVEPYAAPLPSLAVAVRNRAADCGERVFLRFEESRWTYAQAFARPAASPTSFAGIAIRRRRSTSAC